MFDWRSAPAVAAVLLGGCASSSASVEQACPASPFERDIPLVIAHAGGNLVSPSNTMYALHQAVEMGADVLDLDVRMTSDGVVVARHDRELSTTTDGGGAVDETTWATVSLLDASAAWPGDPFDEPIGVPQLNEALVAYPEMLFSLEIKQTTPPMGEQLCSAIAATDSTDRVYISSNDDTAIYQFHAECPDVLLTTTFRDLGEQRDAEAAGEPWCAASPIGQPSVSRGIDAARIADSHRHGSAVFMWTINDPDDLRSAVAAGVDGVYTDRPDLARQIFDEFANSPDDPAE